MIAVLSDLHFEEEASDVIRGDGKEIVFRRNLDLKAYRSSSLRWPTKRGGAR